MYTQTNQTTIEERAGGWVVRVPEAGGVKEFHCATRKMAEQFAAVFARAVRMRMAA